VITTVWIVGLLNAFNFMDGIDGIAGASALAAACTWGATAALVGSSPLAVAAALVAGSSVGFLAWNWSPARIFMGDVASTALGYAFAVLPLMAAGALPPGHAPWIALGAVFPFVYDAASTFARRALRREDVFSAHRTHTYQLLASKLGHPAVAATWAGLALLTGGTAVAFAAGLVGEGVSWGSLAVVVAAVEGARRVARG
jgi:UDP-N-acetylmuramyl pentapeptide phosphotransferase/UDP-N-acetylglucosamine-1-phosphate transferase